MVTESGAASRRPAGSRTDERVRLLTSATERVGSRREAAWIVEHVERTVGRRGG